MPGDGTHQIPAKRLKKSWVQDRKIRGKWRAQKRREGLTCQTSAPAEETSNHRNDLVGAGAESDANKSSAVSLAPSPDEQSLRDLRRIAYASRPSRTQKSDSSRRGGKATAGRETGQPNMSLRMNVVLEKIKRNFS